MASTDLPLLLPDVIYSFYPVSLRLVADRTIDRADEVPGVEASRASTKSSSSPIRTRDRCLLPLDLNSERKARRRVVVDGAHVDFGGEESPSRFILPETCFRWSPDR